MDKDIKSRLKKLTKAQLLGILYKVADDALASRHIYYALDMIKQEKMEAMFAESDRQMKLAKMYAQEYDEIVRKHDGRIADMSGEELSRLGELGELITKAHKKSAELVLKA